MQSVIKVKKCKSFLLFVFTLILFELAAVFDVSEAAACDKSRKIFDGENFGEISHGQNSNYTQVKHEKI